MPAVIKVAILFFTFLRKYRPQIEEFIQFAEKALEGSANGAKLAYVLSRVEALIETEARFEETPFEVLMPFVLGHIDARVAALFPKAPLPLVNATAFTKP